MIPTVKLLEPRIFIVCERCYRMLYAYVKAKVESITFGMHTIEEEFMADIIIKDPSTGNEMNLSNAVLKGGVKLPGLEFKG